MYEIQTGGIWLYWLEDKGSLLDGTQASHAPSECVTVKELFLQNGYWIVSHELGDKIHGRGVLAYVKDKAVTPDLIQSDSVWHCRIKDPPPLPDRPEDNPDGPLGDPESLKKGTPKVSATTNPGKETRKVSKTKGDPTGTPQRTPRGSEKGSDKPARSPRGSETESVAESSHHGMFSAAASMIESMADMDGDEFESCETIRLVMEETAARAGEMLPKFDFEEEEEKPVPKPKEPNPKESPPAGAGVGGLDDADEATKPLLAPLEDSNAA